jgi:hypothetical protein
MQQQLGAAAQQPWRPTGIAVHPDLGRPARAASHSDEERLLEATSPYMAMMPLCPSASVIGREEQAAHKGGALLFHGGSMGFIAKYGFVLFTRQNGIQNQ